MFSNGIARFLHIGPRPESPPGVRFRSRSEAVKPAPSYIPAADEREEAQWDTA
jgi:hypothetical protein